MEMLILFFGRIIQRLRWKLGFLNVFFNELKIAPLVSRQANLIIDTHIKRKGDKALFIDMGSNLGQGFRFFSRYYSPDIFDYWLVEANSFCIDQLRSNVSRWYSDKSWNGNFEIMNLAVSNKEGVLNLYGLVEDIRGKTSEGASVIKDHNSAFYNSNEERALKVQSINASKLIKDASSKYATIVVKMDIEASEYDVLEDLMSTGYINKIVHLYVEWHSPYFSAERKGDMLVRENEIKERLSQRLTNWH